MERAAVPTSGKLVITGPSLVESPLAIDADPCLQPRLPLLNAVETFLEDLDASRRPFTQGLTDAFNRLVLIRK